MTAVLVVSGVSAGGRAAGHRRERGLARHGADPSPDRGEHLGPLGLDKVVEAVVAQLECGGVVRGLQEDQAEAFAGGQVTVSPQFQRKTVSRLGEWWVLELGDGDGVQEAEAAGRSSSSPAENLRGRQ